MCIRIYKIYKLFSFLAQLYGLEKFWAYLKYSGHPKEEVDNQLLKWLEKYKKLEDFRVLVRWFHNSVMLAKRYGMDFSVECWQSSKYVADHAD